MMIPTLNPLKLMVMLSPRSVAWYVPAGTVTVAEPSPLTVTGTVTILVRPVLPFTFITILLVYDWPAVIALARGQSTDPDTIVTELPANWVSGSSIEPSG